MYVTKAYSPIKLLNHIPWSSNGRLNVPAITQINCGLFSVIDKL